MDFRNRLSGVDPQGNRIQPYVDNGEQVDSLRLPPGVTASMVTPHDRWSCDGEEDCPDYPYQEHCVGGYCELLSWISPGSCITDVDARPSSTWARDPEGTSLYFGDCDHFEVEVEIAGAVVEGAFRATGAGRIDELLGTPAGIRLTSLANQTSGVIEVRRPPSCLDGTERVCADYVSVPADSCQDRCGGSAPSGCSCQPTCTVSGDCCADVENFCSVHASKLCVASPAGLRTDRMGGIATTQVGLLCTSSPCASAPVTIQAALSDTSQGALKGPQDATFRDSTTLVFPAGNPSPQTLQIQGKDDPLTVGDRRYQLTLRASSSDATFQGSAVSTGVTNVDRTDHNVCLPDVPTQFSLMPISLTKLPVYFQQTPFQDYAFHTCPFLGIDAFPCPEHFEGIGRTKKGPYLVISGTGQNASHLMVHKLAAKQGIAGRWGSNLDNLWINDRMMNYDSFIVSTVDDHAGGIALFGDFAAVPLEGDSPNTSILFYDMFDPEKPQRVGSTLFHPWDFAGAVAVTKLGENYLLAVMTNEPSAIHFYRSTGSDIRQAQAWNWLGVWSPAAHGFPLACFGVSAAVAATIQNMSFLQDCDGPLYLAVTWNEGDLAGCLWPWGDDKARLYQVNLAQLLSGDPAEALVAVATKGWGQQCYSDEDELQWCNFAHAANFWPSPATRNLLGYAAWGYTEWIYTDIGNGLETRFFMLASEFAAEAAAPAGVTASTGSFPDRIRVSWAAAPGGSSYNVFRDDVPIGTATAPPFDDVAVAACSRPVYSVQTVGAGSVRSVPAASNRGWTSAAPADGVPFAPAPILPSPGALVPSPVTLDWDPACDALDYTVEVATSSSFAPASIVWSANTTDPSTSATAVLAPGVLYYWRVQGTSALGLVGAWSPTRWFTTQTLCGNAICDGSETCSTCPGDCGSCSSCSTISIQNRNCLMCDSTGEIVCGPGTFQWCCPPGEP